MPEGVKMTGQEPLMQLDIKVDYKNSHIGLKDPRVCGSKCKERPCTYICPSMVYEWVEDELKLKYFYERCIECGACKLACPNGNILLQYPAGGYGVVWEY